MTVAELGQRMSGEEAMEWMAFYELEAEDNKRAQQKAELQAKAKANSRR